MFFFAKKKVKNFQLSLMALSVVTLFHLSSDFHTVVLYLIFELNHHHTHTHEKEQLFFFCGEEEAV